ncbi:MAG: molybdenum cofactor guanylyltransferase [Candidatus Kuenenia sp.]|nr:molybdenum cofactor guanylyltransferase [Candidatus Kuenenia hertensis]
MTGIILAGGKSVRMGTNKAFLKYGNTPFIEIQIDILRHLFREIIISANDVHLYDYLKLPVVPDVQPGKGPISGICAGLIQAKYSYAFAIACDMPFVNKEVILYMKGLVKNNDYDVIVPHTVRGPEPLHAFYSKNCIATMQQCLEEENLRLTDFLKKVNVRHVKVEELMKAGTDIKSFINLNTYKEYEKYCS